MTWNQAFGIPERDLAIALLLVAAYYICWLFPVLHSMFFVVARRRSMQKPFVFVVVCTALCYGLAAFFFFILVVPIGSFLAFIAPQLENVGLLQTNDLAWIRYLADKWLLAVPPVFAATSFFIVRWLAARWNRIAEALSG